MSVSAARRLAIPLWARYLLRRISPCSSRVPLYDGGVTFSWVFSFSDAFPLSAISSSAGLWSNLLSRYSPNLAVDLAGLFTNFLKAPVPPFSRCSLASYCGRVWDAARAVDFVFLAGLLSLFPLDGGLSLVTVRLMATSVDVS